MTQVPKIQPPLDNPLNRGRHELLVVGQVRALFHRGEVEDDLALAHLVSGLFDVLVQMAEFGEFHEEEATVALADEVDHLCWVGGWSGNGKVER